MIYYDNVTIHYFLNLVIMTLRAQIEQDYKTINNPPSKTTFSNDQLEGAIAYAKSELKKNPNDPTMRPWLTIIAQKEMNNQALRAELDDLKDFVDNSGKRIILAPIIEKSIVSTEKVDTNNPQITPENIKDIKTLLSYRRK